MPADMAAAGEPHTASFAATFHTTTLHTKKAMMLLKALSHFISYHIISYHIISGLSACNSQI